MSTNYVREWRNHRELTLDQVATAVGATKSAISRLENGNRRMTLDWMEKLAQALDVSPNDLLRSPSDVAKKRPTSMPPGAVSLSEVTGVKSEHLEVFDVKGDGMAPTFSIGDRLVVDKSDRVPTSGIFLVDVGAGPEVKRLATTSKSAILSTDNRSYAPFEVDLKRLRIVGRVVSHIGRV